MLAASLATRVDTDQHCVQEARRKRRGKPNPFYSPLSHVAMHFSGVDVPEPFATALAEGRARKVVDAAADSPAARFGRALCRIAVGSDAFARDDLVALTPELGDSCLIELAFLDLRQRSALRHAAEQARE